MIQFPLSATSTLLAIISVSALILSGCSSPLSVKSSKVSKNAKVVFDGDNYATGVSWNQVSNEELDSVAVVIDTTEGKDSQQSLKVSFAGDNYMGIGWNWKNLWAAAQGDDVRDYSDLKVDIKIVGQALPNPSAITMQLASAAETTPNGRSKAFALSLLTQAMVTDGKWHTVNIPLSALGNTKSSNAAGVEPLNLRYVREFSVATSPEEYVDFDIYVDNIRFE